MADAQSRLGNVADRPGTMDGRLERIEDAATIRVNGRSGTWGVGER